MTGSNNKSQDEFFYSFNLEEVIPEDHLLRSIERFLRFGTFASTWAASAASFSTE